MPSNKTVTIIVSQDALIAFSIVIVGALIAASLYFGGFPQGRRVATNSNPGVSQTVKCGSGSGSGSVLAKAPYAK